MSSPLFPRFNRNQANQSAALRAFKKTQYGQAVDRLSRRYGGSIPQAEMRNLVQQFGKDIEQGMMRYARQTAIDVLMKKLGSFGQLISALLRPGGKPLANPQKELDAAQELLESFGYSVTSPERVKETQTRPEVRTGQPPKRPTGDDTTVGSSQEEQPLQQTPGGPLVEGMIPVTSSNVHSIGYEWSENERMPGNLLVRFLGGTGKVRSGPGSLYRYKDVPRSVFVAFKLAASKGKFVWNELRVRGTVSGHQYDYDLAGTAADGYIPRQAGMKRGAVGEHFLRRTFQGRRSNLPERSVRRDGSRQLPGWENRDNLNFRAGRRP